MPIWVIFQNSVTYVTGSAKTGHNRIFFEFLFIKHYNLLNRVYPLAIFQLHMPITFGVTALQSSNNRKIDMYSKYRENKLQALTKTVVTYQRIDVRSYNFRHHVRREQRNQLLGKFFLYSPFFTAYKGEIREEKLIVYDRFDRA